MDIEITKLEDKSAWKITFKNGDITNEIELRKYDAFRLHEVATKLVNEINSKI